MPRRPAPTALRLYAGPTPPRYTPRHTMPLPPPPTFYPTEVPTVLNATPATEQQSVASSSAEKNDEDGEQAEQDGNVEEEQRIVQEAPPPGLAQDPTRSLHALSKAQNPNSTAPLPMQTHNTNAMIIVPEYHERRQSKKRNNGIGLGPWDRTKNLAFTTDEVDAMITLPKPAAIVEDLGMR